MVTLITGGVRSGKSRYALELAERRAGQKSFLATAEALDEEMKVRIARHQAERGGDFSTVEESLYLARAVHEASERTELILIDCLTLWVNNLLFHFQASPDLVTNQIRSFLDAVRERKTEMILVTNEVGFGIIPDNVLSRRFLDQLGRMNQELAALADEVILMISGIPQVIKGASVDLPMDFPL